MNRKKLVTTVIMALVLVLLAASALAETYWVKTPDGDVVNIRYEDSTNSGILTYKKYGAPIDVITFTKGGAWALFTYEGQTKDGESYFGDAYVMSKYLVSYEPAPYVPSSPSSGQSGSTGTGGLNALFSQAKFVTPYTITVRPTRTSGQVNVRWAPSKGSTLLRAYPADYQLTVIAELGTDWFQVQDPAAGIVGFLNKAYIVK